MTPQERARALRPYIEKAASSLSDNDAMEAVELFPSWSGDSVVYLVGKRVRYNGVLYSCLQEHTSQISWTPDAAPSLWARVLIPDPEVIPVWVQPDSTNPYMTGDRVHYPDENGPVYESLIDNNIWSPEAYPAGWKVVDDSLDETEAPTGDEGGNTSGETGGSTETETQTVAEWTQPTAANPYMTGDRVLFNGSVYESVIDNNVWDPASYPAGWQLIE